MTPLFIKIPFHPVNRILRIVFRGEVLESCSVPMTWPKEKHLILTYFPFSRSHGLRKSEMKERPTRSALDRMNGTNHHQTRLRRSIIIVFVTTLFYSTNALVGRSYADVSPTWTAAPSTNAAGRTEELVELQQKAAKVTNSFIPNKFNPLIKDRHIQTIFGSLLRNECPYLPPDNFQAVQQVLSAVGKRVSSSISIMSSSSSSSTSAKVKDILSNSDKFWDKRERIDTPDDDWFHADTKFCCSSRHDKENESSLHTPIVLVLHGLESNSNAQITTQMAQAFNDIGMDCTCLNFRGCSGVPNNQVTAYHLGFTDDLLQYLTLIKERYNGTPPPIYLSGFSLGANVVLKCLGELGEKAVTEYNICGASVLCPPIDNTRNSKILSQPGINRFVYTNLLLKSMKNKARDAVNNFCNGNEDTDVFDYRRIIAAETIIEFEDAYMPYYGFNDCWDYYRKTSSISFLESIAVSTFILGAQDDPFMDPDAWPIEKCNEFGGPAPLKMVHTKYGGHLGYCFHQVSDPNDKLLVDDGSDGIRKGPPSWAPIELARFLDHVQRANQ